MKEKVLLGMSGGVDSSVAAILLLKQGYEVIGATMKLCDFQESAKKNCGSNNEYDAKKVCDKLGIKYIVLDFRKEFNQYVIKNFIDTYEKGMTPNPCIQCNKHMKFDFFYKKALELGCNFIATGHYAKTEYNKEYDQYVLKKSNAGKKDQSYVLYNIPNEIIPNIIFPLGDFNNKEEIRNIAIENNLEIAKKPDSQEICFIPNNDYRDFLNKNSTKKQMPGNIVDLEGNIIGEHTGLSNYTIGQRKGLGISSDAPLYVIKLDMDNNRLIVGPEKSIYSKDVFATDVNYTLKLKDNIEKIEVYAKIRYNSNADKAILYKLEDNKVKVEFKNPQRAVTKGQSVVFYLNDIVLGGGIII